MRPVRVRLEVITEVTVTLATHAISTTQAPHRTSQAHLRETARVGLGPSQRPGAQIDLEPKVSLQVPPQAPPACPSHSLYTRPRPQACPSTLLTGSTQGHAHRPSHRPHPGLPPFTTTLPSGTVAVFGHPPVVSACSQSLPASYASPMGTH